MIGLGLWGLLGGVALVAAFANSPVTGAIMSTLIVGFVAGLAVAALVHEAGHAVTARLLGRFVALVLVGRGPKLWCANIGRGRLEVRAIPFSGRMVAVSSSERPSRFAHVLIVLAGPLVNLAGAVLMLRLVTPAAADGSVGGQLLAAFLAGGGVAQALLAVTNAFPYKMPDGLASDGLLVWQLLTTWRQPAAHLRWIGQAMLLGRAGQRDAAAEACLRAVAVAPEDPLVLAYTLHCLAHSSDDAAAIAWYETRGSPLATADPSEDPILVWLFANLAFSAIKARREDLTPRIDHWLQSAAAASPEYPQVAATQGMRLVDQGELQRGFETIRSALRQISEPDDRADLCGFLADALTQQGDAPLAAAYNDLRFRILGAAYA